jgi:hypothetical protein
MAENIKWITVEASLGKKQDPVSKIIRAKRVRGVTQAVERLPRKCEALSSNPSISLPLALPFPPPKKWYIHIYNIK